MMQDNGTESIDTRAAKQSGCSAYNLRCYCYSNGVDVTTLTLGKIMSVGPWSLYRHHQMTT